MQIVRHYFISNNLDDLEALELTLENAGLSKAQVHVLSKDDASIESRKNLHDVTSMMKTDVVHSGEIGAVAGLCIAAVFLAAAWLAGWTASTAGWLPFLLIAALILGFCTWEGGFIGIQKTNKNFARFEKALADGNHVFFVDASPEQEALLTSAARSYSSISQAGTERGTPSWLLRGQQSIPKMIQNI